MFPLVTRHPLQVTSRSAAVTPSPATGRRSAVWLSLSRRLGSVFQFFSFCPRLRLTLSASAKADSGSAFRFQVWLPRQPISGFASGSGLRPPRKASGFTLIELLVVIAIIALLAGLAFPAVQGALNSGKKAQARNDVQQIAAAIRAFQLEYGRQPSSETGSDQWVSDNSNVIRALMGNDSTLNPRNITFLSPKMASGRKAGVDPGNFTFYDPWGTPYFIKLNTDYDNVVEYYGVNYVAVIVGSMGPNQQQDEPGVGGSDDIVNYK